MPYVFGLILRGRNFTYYALTPAQRRRVDEMRRTRREREERARNPELFAPQPLPEYIIPEGYPGDMRNGVIYVPGDCAYIADAIIQHLEYLATRDSDEPCRQLQFRPIERIHDLLPVCRIVAASLRGTELEWVVTGYLPWGGSVTFDCPVEPRDPARRGGFRDLVKDFALYDAPAGSKK